MVTVASFDRNGLSFFFSFFDVAIEKLVCIENVDIENLVCVERILTIGKNFPMIWSHGLIMIKRYIVNWDSTV